MENLTKRGISKLLITHVDGDGVGCYMLARYYNEYFKFTSWIMRDYGFENEEDNLKLMKRFSEIVITDLSISREVLEELLDFGIKVSIYDHHKSSLDNLGDLEHPNFYFDHDLERSGTKIFYEDFVLKQIEEENRVVSYYVNLVDVYDLWKLEDDFWSEALDLNHVLNGRIKWSETDIDKRLGDFATRLERKFDRLPPLGKEWIWNTSEIIIIQEQNYKIETRLKQALNTIKIRVDNKGRRFGFFILDSKISFVASRILQEYYTDLDYLIIVNNYGSQINGRLSARSSNGFDCTELLAFNGHKEAAGGTVDVDEAINFLSNEKLVPAYKTTVLEPSDLYLSPFELKE